MSKVDSADRSALDEIAARAATRPSGVYVAAGQMKVLMDGDIGAYCDEWGQKRAAERAAQQAALSAGTHDAVRDSLDGDTTRDAKNK